jgi:hypothetical protein
MLRVVGHEAVDGEVDGRFLLDEIAREGARRMLLAALETEVAAYLEAHATDRDATGHALVVRNGKGRARKVTIGAGTIAVNAPRMNNRRVDAGGQRCKFTSRILPPYMRTSPHRRGPNWSRACSRREDRCGQGLRHPVVAHPFASMLVPLGWVQHRLNVGLHTPPLLRIRDAYLEVFS